MALTYGPKGNPELLKLMMESLNKEGGIPPSLGMSLSQAGKGMLDLKIAMDDIDKSKKLQELMESIGKHKSGPIEIHEEPKPTLPLSAEDFCCGPPNAGYKFGISPDDAAKTLRHMADLVEQGLYLLKSVAAGSEATGEEFPTHSLVINYSLFHQDHKKD